MSNTGCQVKRSLDKALLLQLTGGIVPKASVLLRDSNHPNICWKRGMVSCRQPWRLLKCMWDHFLTQVTDRPARGEAFWDLLVTKANGDIRIGGSNHALDVDQVRSKVELMNFREADFQLFGELVSGIP